MKVKIAGENINLFEFNTVIVGSGNASLNCAVHLVKNGIKDIAMVTENLSGGTSANAVSDKMTYYKLSNCARLPDSPFKMAQELYNLGSMDGDIALVEASCSLIEFYHLVELGVKFPYEKYGGFPGYITDNDRTGRATSAGPLTSKDIHQCLLREVRKFKIPVFTGYNVVKILIEKKNRQNHAVGLIAMKNNKNEIAVFNVLNIVFGTGGPGALYKYSVYPPLQTGSIGVALEAGAIARNLGESQFGIASKNFHCNFSGTYQQVVPRYFSTDKDGKNPDEFLNKYFKSMSELAEAIFLKGHQWPFDARKVFNYGSSLIDIAIYYENTVLRRKVFIDFTKNPQSGHGLKEFNLRELPEKPYNYLKKSDALLETPIKRLERINPFSIEIFRKSEIDLRKTPVEINICFQHNNGGLKGNIWWESNLKHFFPIGEVCGTHGVYRPGGSALNSGQVAGYRTAQYISKKYFQNSKRKITKSLQNQIKDFIVELKNIVDKNGVDIRELKKIRNHLQTRMSSSASIIREGKTINETIKEIEVLLKKQKHLKIKNKNNIFYALKNRELLFTSLVYLTSIKKYIDSGGPSRGSYLIKDKKGIAINKYLDSNFRFKKYSACFNEGIIETFLSGNGKIKNRIVKRKPVPVQNLWFENLWKDFIKNKIFV